MHLLDRLHAAVQHERIDHLDIVARCAAGGAHGRGRVDKQLAAEVAEELRRAVLLDKRVDGAPVCFA